MLRQEAVLMPNTCSGDSNPSRICTVSEESFSVAMTGKDLNSLVESEVGGVSSIAHQEYVAALPIAIAAKLPVARVALAVGVLEAITDDWNAIERRKAAATVDMGRIVNILTADVKSTAPARQSASPE